RHQQTHQAQQDSARTDMSSCPLADKEPCWLRPVSNRRGLRLCFKSERTAQKKHPAPKWLLNTLQVCAPVWLLYCLYCKLHSSSLLHFVSKTNKPTILTGNPSSTFTQ
ncbi:hypothetical protein ATANTOWER_019706, partial [Ataeniobius toweri]|nr:hypothetical protein [Ataeniobius toweri]